MGQNQNGSDDDWLSSDIEKFEYDLDGIRISLIFGTYARQKWYKKNTKPMSLWSLWHENKNVVVQS